MFSEWQPAMILTAMLILPGWAILSLNQEWRQWATLQRWCLAVGISIAFYPVLFYATRFVLPSFSLGAFKLFPLLAVCAAVIGWRMRTTWRDQFAFDRLEWATLAIFGMTLFTRFWIIRDYPYPAWTDSLHHVLLTQLTAASGRLPVDMQPYFPIPLGQYHLGLYALSGSLEMLSRVPAHTALLWTAQALNGLCGIGVYLVLDRLVGRPGAIVGAAVVGLLSYQPAWYVNWGRFTQLASQAVLLIAWLVTWRAISAWRQRSTENKWGLVWQTTVAALLTAAVFLLHFRVAAFYLPLLAIALAWELAKGWKESSAGRVALGSLIIGAVALLAVSPALWEAVRIYIGSSVKAASTMAPGETLGSAQGYFGLSVDAAAGLAAQTWLIDLAVVGAAFGVLRRNKLVIAAVIWIAVLVGIGEAYLLNLPLLAFTNLSGIVIMFYLPIGLIVGAAAEELLRLFGATRHANAANIMVVITLAAGFLFSHVRVGAIEPYRYFVTPADVTAMDWIKNNTPSNALFAVNTVFWQPEFPHGTDAGYWIAYFTGRRTTASAMLFPLGPPDYSQDIAVESRAVKRLETDTAALDDLRGMGVSYVYIGSRGNFEGPGLDAARLRQCEGVTLVYQREGASIFRIGD